MSSTVVLAPIPVALVACAVGLAVQYRPANAKDDHGVVKQVLAYEEAVKSVKTTWSSRVFYPKGSIVSAREDVGWEPYDAPSEDVRVESSISVAIDGNNAAYHANRMIWSVRERGFRPYIADGAFVNGVGRDSITSSGYGMITHGGNINLDYGNTPLFAAYRFFNSALGLGDPETASIVADDEYSGHPCTVIDVLTRSGGSSRYRCWIAQDMPGCILRLQHLKDDGELILEADMRYAEDDKVGWHLQSWNLNFQWVRGSSSNTATEVRINEPTDPAVFEVKFPAGMTVYDRIKGAEYISGGEAPAQRDDALSGAAMDKFVEQVRKETPTPKPPRPTAAPAPAAPPVQAVAPPRTGFSPWLLVGGGALSILLIAAILLSRRRSAG